MISNSGSRIILYIGMFSIIQVYANSYDLNQQQQEKEEDKSDIP